MLIQAMRGYCKENRLPRILGQEIQQNQIPWSLKVDGSWESRCLPLFLGNPSIKGMPLRWGCLCKGLTEGGSQEKGRGQAGQGRRKNKTKQEMSSQVETSFSLIDLLFLLRSGPCCLIRPILLDLVTQVCALLSLSSLTYFIEFWNPSETLVF